MEALVAPALTAAGLVLAVTAYHWGFRDVPFRHALGSAVLTVACLVVGVLALGWALFTLGVGR
jgi:hypothetical protein